MAGCEFAALAAKRGCVSGEKKGFALGEAFFQCFLQRMKLRNAQGVCCPGRDTAVRRKSFFSILFVPNKKYGKSCRGAAKDLILLGGSWCLSGLIRGLENLEALFGKALILLVRSRHCGELNRGSQNLDVLCNENEFILFACTKRTKSTPEVCEPLDSGDDSKLCRKYF